MGFPEQISKITQNAFEIILECYPNCYSLRLLISSVIKGVYIYYSTASDLLSTVARLSQGLMPVMKEEKLGGPQGTEEGPFPVPDNPFEEQRSLLKTQHGKLIPGNPFDSQMLMRASPSQQRQVDDSGDGDADVTIDGACLLTFLSSLFYDIFLKYSV